MFGQLSCCKSAGDPWDSDRLAQTGFLTTEWL